MPISRDVPHSLGDRLLSPRQEAFRHSYDYFPDAASRRAAGDGERGMMTNADKMSSFGMAGDGCV